MNDNFLFHLSNVTTEEMIFVKEITKDFNDEQKKNFAMIYSGKRRDPQHVLIFTILGFFGIAGIQRFVTNQIGMGILYFFTAGLCFIGTIVDLVNHKSIANEYNHKMALESRLFVSM